MSDSLSSHGLQHIRPPHPSASPRSWLKLIRSLLKLMSVNSVMPSNYLILCHPILPLSIFPSIKVFSSQSILHIREPRFGGSASGAVLPMNIQDSFPLGLSDLISLQSIGLWWVFSNTTVQKHQLFGAQLSFFLYFFFFFCSGFCHTLKWISHGFTCDPYPDPPSHLPLHTIPLGLPSAPGPSACLMHPTWAGDLFHPR